MKKIIFIRHGQSEGNVDYKVYDQIPDDKIPLTGLGEGQAELAGKELAETLGSYRPKTYCSTHKRAIQTLEGIKKTCPNINAYPVSYDPRLIEQKWGNMGDSMDLELLGKHGHFQYKPNTGECGLEVYVRIKQFLSEIENANDTIVIISHGITINIFLMILFGWLPDEFNEKSYPANCKPIVVEKIGEWWRFIKNKPKKYEDNKTG